MRLFAKKSELVEARQWFGGYPIDDLTREGIVHLDTSGSFAICDHCNTYFCVHGHVKTPEGGRIVCPGDWVTTNANGEHRVMKPDIFGETYSKVATST